jgi:hypothetical protein
METRDWGKWFCCDSLKESNERERERETRDGEEKKKIK